MKYKLNTYYIATKGNKSGTVLENDRLLIKKYKHSNLGEFTMFLPPRKTDKRFFGMEPLNTVLYFKNKEELNECLNGVEARYDFVLVNTIIDEKQKQIDKLKKDHELK